MPDEKIAPMRQVRASEMNWLRRPDMGASVWETPGGGLYHHDTDDEPILVILDGSPDWSRPLKENTRQ